MSAWSIGGGFFSVFDTADGTTVSLAAIKAQTDSIAAVKAQTDTIADVKAKTDSLTFTVAGKVDSNALAVAGTTITGSGTAGDPWGP